MRSSSLRTGSGRHDGTLRHPRAGPLHRPDPDVRVWRRCGARAPRRQLHTAAGHAGRAHRPVRVREVHPPAPAGGPGHAPQRPDRLARAGRQPRRPPRPHRHGVPGAEPAAPPRRDREHRPAPAAPRRPGNRVPGAGPGGRLAAAGLGVTFAVALLAALGSFLGASKATMTHRAIGQVAVDWQVEAQPGADPAAVQSALRSDSQVTAALPVGFAATTGLKASHGATTPTPGSGGVLGLPPGYQATFPGELRHLTGSADGVLIAQQTAANLHAAVGDVISIGRAGMAPVQVRVDGVVDLPQADSLFQRIGVIASAQPKAPPDNVLLLPKARWQQFYGSLAGSRPDVVKTQVHVRLRHDLPADPAAAFTA